MMLTPNGSSWMLQPIVPVIYLQIELNLAEERGLDPQRLMKKIGLSSAVLGDPEALVSNFMHAWLVRLIVKHSGNHGLGFEIGLRMLPTAHGYLGYAVLSSSTLRKASAVIKRFWHLRDRGTRISYGQEDGWDIVDFWMDVPLFDELRQIFFEGVLATYWRAIELLLGKRPEGELWLDYPEPDYYVQYRHHFPPIRFDMPTIQVRLPTAIIDQPLQMANPNAFKLALAQCERENQLQSDHDEDVLAQVQALLTLSEDGYPSLDTISERLHTTPRTLRRKLQNHGTSFKQLLELTQRQDAIKLLDNSALEIQKIAELLGYLNPASFTRAFHRWTGMVPRQYRISQIQDN